MTTKIKGFTPVSDKLIQELGLICAAVYGKVWRYCDNFGKCTASKARIADELGLSERTVFNHLQELEKNEYIKIAHRTGETSIITVTNKITYETAVQELHGGQALDAEGVGNRCMGGGQEMPEGGALDADKDTNEDSKQDNKQETISHNIGWVKICERYKLSVDVWDTMLTNTQRENMEKLLVRDAEKCVKIAVYYNNEGMHFQRMIGKIINNFDTWKTDSKKEPRRKKERVV